MDAWTTRQALKESGGDGGKPRIHRPAPSADPAKDLGFLAGLPV